MKKRELCDRLHRASEQLPRPDGEYAACAPVQPLEVHDHITRQLPVVRRRRPRLWFVLFAACLALCLALGRFYWRQNLMVYSTVRLSVNPVFTIELNRRDNVLTVEGEDSGAEALLEGRSYRNWALEPTLTTLLSDLGAAGYDLENATVRVSDDSPNRADLRQRAQAVLDTALTALPTPTPTPETPAPTPPAVEGEHHDEMPPAGLERLTSRQAKDIALARAPGADIRQCQLEEDDGVWYYDLELSQDGIPYDVEIHATTGEILKWERDD